MNKNQYDFPGIIIITIFLILLSYAGYLAYKSIDWDVLKRLEAQPIVLPTPVPTTPVASPTAVLKK